MSKEKRGTRDPVILFRERESSSYKYHKLVYSLVKKRRLSFTIELDVIRVEEPPE